MAGGVAADAARRARRRRAGLFEVDEFWLGRRRRASCGRARCCSATSSATSSTATASSRRSPTRWAAVVGAGAGAARSSSTPTTRSSPTSGRDRDDVVYFGVEDDGVALAGAAARLRRQALPPLRRALRLRRASTSATSAATTATTAARARPTPHGRRARHRARGHRAARAFTLRTPAGRRATSRCPSPGLYNVYNALARGGARAARSARRSTTIAAGLQAVRAAFGRAETRARRRPRAGDPARQEPGRAPTRSCARSRSRPASTTCSRVLNDHIADGRDVCWIWDADFELLARPRAPRRRAAGTRAAEMALRLKYAGVADGADRASSPTSRAALDRGASPAGRRAALFALPTYTAMLALREVLVAPRRRPRSRSREPRPRRRLARPRVRRLRRRPAAVARAGRSEAGGPVLDVGAGTGRVALDLARRGHEVVALDADAGAARGARASARDAACRSRPSPATRASFDLGRTLPARSSCRCRRSSCSAAPAAARRFLRARRAPPGARRAARASRSPTRSSAFDARARPSRPLPDIARGRRRASTRAGRWRSATTGDRVAHRARARGRRRATATPHESTTTSIELDRVDADDARGARRAAVGLRAAGAAAIPQTDEYVGSTVVMLGA